MPGWPIAAAFAAASTVFVLWQRERRRRLANVTSLLERPVISLLLNKVSGTYHGHSISYYLESRGSGHARRVWTEVHVATPRLPFKLELRPETREEREMIARGLALDLQTGDARFDARFVVEAAPSDVILKLLDAEVRAALLRLVDCVDSLEGGLRLRGTGHVLVRKDVTRLLDLAARLVDGLRPAFAAADAELEAAAPRAGAPFRAEPDASHARAGHETRAEELANLERVRSRAWSWLRNRVILVALGIGLMFGGIIVFALLMQG